MKINLNLLVIKIVHIVGSIMVLLQFKFINLTDDEQQLISAFNTWLCDVVFNKIYTKINRKKVSLRLNYILNDVRWIQWQNNKYNITTKDIFMTIYNSLCCVRGRNNLYKLQINGNVLIPYSMTSIDRLVRFINYGDTKFRATGIFTRLENEFNHKMLNSMWQLFLLKNGINGTNSKIIAR